MTQQAAILYLLRSGPKTTNDLIASPYHLAAEYRARIVELRQQGYGITCETHTGGASVWTLVSELPPPVVTSLAGSQFVFKDALAGSA